MLDVYRPYPGVALVVVEEDSILLGAPADAFKATKAFCQKHTLPFPRVLVSPERRLAHASPQFVPEFFLYDFLFVYGAAFKPELERERLTLVLDQDGVEGEKRVLGITLNGPSRAELAGYRDEAGAEVLDHDTIAMLASISEHMAIKKGDRARTLEEMIETKTFDRHGEASVLGGALAITRTGPTSFRLRAHGREVVVDLAFTPPVIPYATLPLPKSPQSPATFAIKPLGTRSGFDLSGPSTGFLFWINGRAVIYDGPVGTRYLLERQGINPDDIDAVILSHCHEDHMGAFAELVLGGLRPKVYTTEPIYRSLLLKLGHQLRLGASEAASFVDYRRVTPGTKVELCGATFDFFYTVHSIPTIGVNVSMRGPQGTYTVQISGDTMSHDGIAELCARGVISEATHERMRALVPARLDQNAIFFADVGEALIHGHPKDWQENPNRVLYYHCPDNDHTQSFGREIAAPGSLHTLIEAPRLHPAVPSRVLRALSFLDVRDPRWFAELLHRGRLRSAGAGEVLAAAGAPGDTLSVIISGTAEVLGANGELITELHPGELFGAIELVDGEKHHRATVRALSPIELYEVEGALLFEYLEQNGLMPTLARVAANRPDIDATKLFQSLKTSAKSRIAALASVESHAAGEVIFRKGTVAEDFYVLVAGSVAIEIDGEVVRKIRHDDEDNFFGEISALLPNRRRNATVRAASDARVLRLRGSELRSLFEAEMAIRYTLLFTLKDRGGGR